MKPNHQLITEKYLEFALSIDSPNKKILKTDVFNEYKSMPKEGGIVNNLKGDVYCIDINEKIVDKCKQFLKNCFVGNIKHLQFKNNFFDVVLDFSTVDHVQDYNKALSEYYRVLKDNGEIIIVFWTSNKERFVESHTQYYFDEKKIFEDLNKLFIETERILLCHDRWRKLYCFKGKKINNLSSPWKYLNDQNILSRQIIAAHFLKSYNIQNIIEIGGGN